MAILTWIARSEFKIPDNIATPCSVKAKGRYFECSPLFKVAFCDLKDLYSSFDNSNRKSFGNLLMFLRTASFQSSGFLMNSCFNLLRMNGLL